jgi:Xaa-Pro dipeptidase
MLPHLADLYPAHLATVRARTDAALAAAGFDHLLVPSGVQTFRFLDDNPCPFFANAQFKHWLPLTEMTDCWLIYTPGSKPVLAYHQPADYWHMPPQDPSGYWVEHFEVKVTRTPEEAERFFPKDPARCAIVGEDNTAVGQYRPNNPPKLINYLHYHRAVKTAYELQAMRAAQQRATRAHRAAEAAFRDGASEYDIHLAYINAAAHAEGELPYRNIVALNRHGAVLHYQHQSRVKPAQHRSLLIDAGAQVHGYAADITRTYGDGGEEFAALLEAVDGAQRKLVSGVRAGTPEPDQHLGAHRLLAGVLQEQDIVRMSPEAQVETGVSSVFYPHGLGHLIGLQVHDVAGFQKNEAGELIDKPKGHPYLRLTRTLEPDQVLTVEPGVYFIDMLLAGLRSGPHGKVVNWEKVGRLGEYGGVRIEDDVRVTEGEPENLTRNAFAELSA